MSVNENGFSFGMAYTSVSLALNGFKPGTALVGGNTANISPSEEDAIKNGLLHFIELVEEDVDGDGTVDHNDAAEIYSAALDKFISEVDQEDSDGMKLSVIRIVNFNLAIGKSDVDDAVRDYLMNFYRSICDAEDDGFALETAERNVLETIENCLYDKG